MAHLGGFLAGAGLPLREGRSSDFFSTLWGLSLRKEDRQRNLFTKYAIFFDL